MTNLEEKEVDKKNFTVEVRCDNCGALLFKVTEMSPPINPIQIKCRRCDTYTYT